MTGENCLSKDLLKTIDHIVVQYVDDSTNIVSSKDPNNLQQYINAYYKLIESYYGINFLKLNADKTKLLVTCRPIDRGLVNNISLLANTYIINQSEKVKVLGIYYTSGLDQTPNVSNIIKKVNYRMSTLNKITYYTNTATSLILYNSIVVSVFRYCIENYMNLSQRNLDKLNVLLNKCSHRILGITSYRLTTTTILNNLKWLSIPQMICYQSLLLVHKLSMENKPLALTKYLYHSLHRSELERYVRKPSVAKRYKTAITKNSFIHRSVYIYNNILPDMIRSYTDKKYKNTLKKHISTYFHTKNIPKIPD